MKKIVYLFIGVLAAIPLVVKADMSAPEIKVVKVTPKESAGAPFYDYQLKKTSKTLKYGDKFKVSYEQKNDGVLYGCSYEDDSLCVKMSDVKTVDKNEKDKDDVAKYVGRVFAKDGLEMYEGPSYAYEKIGKTIPKDTELKIADLSRGVGTWVYVEYDGVGGYVDTDEAALGQLFNHKIIISDNNKKFGSYFDANGWDRTLYVKEDGKYKAYSTYNYGGEFQYTDSFTLETDCKVYKYANAGGYEDGVDKTVVGSLKKGEKVNISYVFGDYGYEAYYVETDDVKGWLVSTEEDDGGFRFSCFDVDYDKLTKKKDYKEYDDWKVLAADYFKDQDVKPSDDKKDDKQDGLNLSPKMIITLSCCGAAAVALSGIVICVLVNKKKNKKEDSVQE